MKKYYLATLSEGCPKNILESASYRKVLEENGYDSVSTADEADVVVLNTCGCLETIQNKAKAAIEKTVGIREKQNDLKIIVAGCYPLVDKANTLKENNISFFPPGEVEEFKQILNLNTIESANTHALYLEDINKQPAFVTKPAHYLSFYKKFESLTGLHSSKLENFFRGIMMNAQFHYVILGKGCLGNCTFCGIKLAIGNPVSRSLNEIVNNVRKGIVNGKRDIWLVSDDVGCWGSDIGSNSAVLLKEILAIPSPMNLVVNYFEPEMLLEHYKELLPSLTDRRVTQICIPIQTGSQRLLKRMGRHYDIPTVLEKVEELRRINPGLVIKTQLITSFPGETWEDYLKTLKAMKHFDGIGVNSYARLKFTPAYKLKPNPEWVTKFRTKIAKLLSSFFHLRFVLNTLVHGTRQ